MSHNLWVIADSFLLVLIIFHSAIDHLHLLLGLSIFAILLERISNALSSHKRTFGLLVIEIFFSAFDHLSNNFLGLSFFLIKSLRGSL